MTLRGLEAQSTRRVLVIAAALLWAALVSPFPRSLDGGALPLTLGLLAIDVALGVLTGWTAFAWRASLDERQAALRDRAYHVAFRLVALGVIVMLVAVIVGSISGDHFAPQTEPVLGGRWVIGLLQLLVGLPTLVIAWFEPSALAEDEMARRSSRLTSRWLPLIVIPCAGALWLALIGSLPVRASAVQNDAMHGSMEGATCGHFIASREVGYGFGAQLRVDVQPCWNGDRAFTYPGERPEFLSRCSALPGTADFARLSNLKCSERTDADGSLHYTMRATVESALGATIARDITLELAITRNGVASTVG